ncbi:hypothetical protein EMPS_06627 [Entomortierella parvispora]|uniref:Arm-like repeat domain-containing protein n=1 Tax=Entomortierella parvispora TaxID=205924 RepID=A0A9P3HCN1_9FUNG|nr:hypothetical protein EMPS_06627 [Entomortierella parvispora]
MRPWYKRSLSSNEAIGRANTHLENGWNTKDRRLAHKHCDKASEALERMNIANCIKDRGLIAAVYREHGRLLEKLGLGDEARLSYKKADGLIRALGGGTLSPTSSISSTPSSTLSPSLAPNSPPSSASASTLNRESAIPTIFTKDCSPPIIHCTLPIPDERLVSTRQLALYLALLQDTPTSASLDSLDPAARAWVTTTKKNQDETDRLRLLATDLIRALARDELKDRMVMSEALCLAPVLEKDDYRSLLSLFVSAVKDSLLLDVYALEGLARLVQSAAPGYLHADDLVKILDLLSTRLQETFQQSPQYISELAIALSCALDAMADSSIQGLDRVKLHEPLLSYLNQLKADKDPYIVYQAAYASQALMCVPDNEAPWQAALRRSGALIVGVGGVVCAIKGLDVSDFLDGLRTIREGLQGAGRVLDLVQDTYNGMASRKGSDQSLLESLKSGLSFSLKREWYAALRGADSLIRNGELTKLKSLVCGAPCRRDLPFQWGICQQLGNLAANPVWDDDSRKDAITFLGELYWDDEEWGEEPRIKRCILDILMRLSQGHGYGTKGPINIAAENLLEDLATDGDVHKQSLYLECIQAGPSAHSWKVTASPSDSTFLIDQVQNKPSVQPVLRKYQRRRLLEQEIRHAVYIPPQAKASRESSDDDLFDLTTRVNEFITGDGDGKVLLIFGDSGSGKSTFNLELERNLWKAYNSDKIWIPIFVALPGIDKPGEDLIAKQLRRYDFTENQIRELKSYCQFVLICDGYDECQKMVNLYNDNRLNMPGEWKVKMVISCRSEFLGFDYRVFFQPGNHNDRRGARQLQEAVIAPFNVTRITDYIRNYTIMYRSATDTVWRPEDYERVIKSIPNLNELVRNPFLLSLALEVLPYLIDLSKDFTSTTISRVTLYDEFLEQWVERSQRRLTERKLSADDHTQFKILSEDGFIRNTIGFVKDLAVAIFDMQDGKPVVEYSPIRDKSTWKTTFFGHGHGKNLLREACPLSRTGNCYRFIHRSVLEYGLARAAFEPRPSGEVYIEQLDVQQRINVGTLLSNTPSDSPLFRKSFVHEPSIINFLSERVQQSIGLEDQLHKFIDQSKTDERFSQAAANAITILVRAGVRFSGADLRGIRIPGADLSYGDFDSAQLQGADLRDTILRNVWLHQADLSHSRMEGVKFGEYPYLEVEDAVKCCVFSPDGEHLTVGLNDGTIYIYNTSTWNRRLIRGHPNNVASVVNSPSSHQIASGSEDKTIQLWDLQDGSLGPTMSGHLGGVTSAVYSPNGRRIVSGSWDKTVRLWDAQTGALNSTIFGHTGCISSVAYSPSGHQIVSGSWDKTARLWDAQTGVLISTISGHTGGITSVAYSPDGSQIATGSEDKTVQLLDANTGRFATCLSGHTGGVTSVAYSPSGFQIATGSEDKTVRLWDANTGTFATYLSGHTDTVTSVAYSPCGGKVASGSWDATVRMWDAQISPFAYSFRGHTHSVTSVAYSLSGHQVATGSEDKTVRLWDAQTGAFLSSLSGHTNTVTSVAYSPSGYQIASGSLDETVRLWDAKSGTLSFSLSGHNDGITSVVYSPCGLRIASGSLDKTIRLWDAQTGDLVLSLKGHAYAVMSVAFSPNGHQIASGSEDETIRLWDAKSGVLVASLSGHINGITSVVYSPSGHQIASGSWDATVRLWDTETGALAFSLSGHTRKITSVVYSPNGRQIASGSSDETVRLWDVNSGECLFTLEGFQDVANGIAWKTTLDSTYLVVCGDTKSVRSWKVTEEENQVRVRLHWRSTPDTLVVSNASIQGVQGLSEINMRLLQQRRAVGQPEPIMTYRREAMDSSVQKAER